jgi:hypothetical protein
MENFLNRRFIYPIIAASLIIFSSCSNDDETTPTGGPEFDASLSNTNVTLSSQYSSSTSSMGSFYASKTKTVGTSSTSTGADVDVTYADIAISGSALDQPVFVSPDSRASVNQGGTNGPISNLANAGTTYFKATSLDLSTATAKQVSDSIQNIGSAKSVAISGENSNYLFSNSTTGKKGIIKVTALIDAETSTNGQNTGETTTNIKFDIKVLK